MKDRLVEARRFSRLRDILWPAEEGVRQVVITPLGLTYAGETLAVRG